MILINLLKQFAVLIHFICYATLIEWWNINCIVVKSILLCLSVMWVYVSWWWWIFEYEFELYELENRKLWEEILYLKGVRSSEDFYSFIFVKEHDTSQTYGNGHHYHTLICCNQCMPYGICYFRCLGMKMVKKSVLGDSHEMRKTIW